MADEKIMEKIKKLLSLSTSSNEHEAATALAKAQSLMAEYNLTMGQIKLSDVREALVQSKTSVSKPKDWETNLFRLVADAFGCQLAWRDGWHRTNGTYSLVGLKHRVELAEYAAAVLGKKLVNARSAFVATLPTGYRKTYLTEQANGFCKGWVAAVKSKVVALALGAEEKLLIEGYAAENFKDGEKTVKSTQYRAAGYEQGLEAGKNESLHRPMTGGKGYAKLGNS